MSTPGPGGPQPPEQDPAQQPDQPQNWGQQQPPVGQPGPGQQSWGAAQPVPGQEPAGQVPGQQPWGAPQQPTGAQAFGAPGQQDKPKRKLVPILISVLAVVAVALLAFSLLSGGASAEAGDCVNDDPDEIGVVACDSDEAAFEVVGVEKDVTQTYMQSEQSCIDWPETVYVAWEGADEDLDTEGTGYCLVELGS